MMEHNRHVDEHSVVQFFSRLPWIYCAVLAGTLALELHGSRYLILGKFDLPLLLLPWAAGILVLAIGRAGPVKNWAVPWLISFSFPVIIVKYGIHLTRMSSSFGSASGPAVFLFFVLVVPVAWYLRCLARMSPRRCPGCGRVSLIPLMEVDKQDERSANTRWCAGCGGKYWKDRRAGWQPERRTTWHDRQADQGKSATTVGPHVPSPAPASKTKATPASPTTMKP
jgi:hypothetical protein